MSNSENLVAFEVALREDKNLQEKFEAAKKRIAENGEASGDADLLVKAASAVGFTFCIADLERNMAQSQELIDDELEIITGGIDTWCWRNYGCYLIYKDQKDSDTTSFGQNQNIKFG